EARLEPTRIRRAIAAIDLSPVSTRVLARVLAVLSGAESPELLVLATIEPPVYAEPGLWTALPPTARDLREHEAAVRREVATVLHAIERPSVAIRYVVECRPAA